MRAYRKASAGGNEKKKNPVYLEIVQMHDPRKRTESKMTLSLKPSYDPD